MLIIVFEGSVNKLFVYQIIIIFKLISSRFVKTDEGKARFLGDDGTILSLISILF